MKNLVKSQIVHDDQFGHNIEHTVQTNTIQEHASDSPKPQTKEMLVLGELNNGTKTFENVIRNTDLNSDELNLILDDLEKQGLVRVEQKQGLFGPKVELYCTEKGFKEYYS